MDSWSSETGRVMLGVVNHEAGAFNYTVRVGLAGARVVYNATAGFDETVGVNRKTWPNVKARIANGANWTESYFFAIRTVGLRKVRLLLFKDVDFSVAYRGLHVYVTVA